MKLLLYDMGAYTQQDIMETLDKMGIEYRNILYKLADVSGDVYFEKRVKELLAKEVYNAVFSVNYFPVLARICAEKGIPYISWSYDSPIMVNDIEDTLGYDTNYVFFFDRAECERYQRKGFGNVFHLPLAVNTERLDKIELTKEDTLRYGAEVSLVGQLYESVLPLLMEPLGDYEKGYLTAAIETQMRLYGSYFLPQVITEELIQKMNQCYEELGLTDLKLEKDAFIITVAKQITHMERTLLLDTFSENYKVNLYGSDSHDGLPNVYWQGSAGYFDEMPKVFKSSKINLNISLKCIESGIPLRALDIMGSGGFLLTNYQPEIAKHFVDGEEVVMYTSLEDAVAKCEYYLEHEDERKEIAKRGYEKVKRQFGYEGRIRRMLEMAGITKDEIR